MGSGSNGEAVFLFCNIYSNGGNSLYLLILIMQGLVFIKLPLLWFFLATFTILSDELGDHYTMIRAFSSTYGLAYLEVGPEAIRFLIKNGPEAKQ